MISFCYLYLSSKVKISNEQIKENSSYVTICFTLNVFRMVVHLLEILDGCFSTFSTRDESLRSTALELATSFMTGSVSTSIQNQAKALLAALHPTKKSYHNHKVSLEIVKVFLRNGAHFCISASFKLCV